MAEPRVTLAAIAGPHGIDGGVRLKLFAESADAIARFEQVQVGDRELTIKSMNAAGGQPIARFHGIADRNAAEALRGQLVTVARDALPPLAEGEYYHVDLIGLRCVDCEGADVGIVAAVENFGAGDLLEIERPDGKKSLIPFKPGVADLADGTVTVDPAFLA
ncbi:ribosome maturation factor RimM [Allosphingosinicella indica]|uniref:Ribosome maturation factor RimM n=1 Tax=Allosphingosinicella indica TaxID=941907 RepID=A0A1X7GYR9_9SPHN|nr:ribosome maturation factor RimM [Allosphingosinicella indica]SMF76020.1 16S rRNA processing protein RimM [Allosphingosinicella indica]